MDYEQIRYRVDDGLLTLTLDRPEKLNAFTTRMMYELLDAFDRADADPPRGRLHASVRSPRPARCGSRGHAGGGR